MRQLRLIAVLGVSGLLAVGGFLAIANADAKVISGSCSIELQAVRTTTTIDLTTPSTGLCVTSDGLADATFTADDLTVDMGTTCALGRANGGGRFELEFNPVEGISWTNLNVTVIYAEPDIEIVFEKTEENSSIVASGTFAQSPTSDSACDTSSSGATFTWSGTIVFEDPVFE